MDHDVALRGDAYTLRPVRRSDAASIVELRRQAGPYINRGAATVDQQVDWIEQYLARAGDYYFAAERTDDGEVDCLAAIYDVDEPTRHGEWGRFVVRKGSSAAVETALLVYRVAFDVMRLERVVCRTLIDNAQVVAFHDSCGLARADAPVAVTLDGVPALAVEHRLDRAGWPSVQSRLAPLVRRLAARRRNAGSR